MRSASLAFLLGTATILGLVQLPSLGVAWSLLVSSLLVLCLLPPSIKFWLRLPLIAALGFGWVVLHADHELKWNLPQTFVGKTLTIIGTVASIPELKNNLKTFTFAVQRMQLGDEICNKSALIRLSWYSAPANLQIGGQWQLTVRLKPPRGYWDEGSFDYQKWLFEEGIRATGYVVVKGTNAYQNSSSHYYVDGVRSKLADGITASLRDRPLAGLIAALAVGIRSTITESQWAVLRGTGTNHLFAIAGLHIGLVTGVIYFIVGFLWPRLGRLPLYFPTPQIAALGALMMAIIYSALAGFAMPTKRAILMITIFLLATLWRKNLSSWVAWSLALFLILILEPLAVLDDSFWLSFTAVALIIYGSNGRVNQHGLWWHWGRTQWVMAVGLIPLCLLFFQQTSLVGFLANSIAIPWVGFIVLPLSLLGSLTWFISTTAAKSCWLLAEHALECVWPLLETMAKVHWLQWEVFVSNPWILAASLVAAILLLAPRGFSARWMGLIWALPLIVWLPKGPAAGEVWFTLLDVGQGLATVVRTQHHVLIYDTGPRFNQNFDTGNAVVIPFLRHAGIRTVDTMMISHGDNDHIGGANSILTTLPVKQVLTSVPDRFKPGVASLCMTGQSWQWDGVVFLFYIHH